MDITDKSVIKWQRLQIKNLEDEISRLKTNLNGSQLVLQESIKEYIDEILKNTIERQEILIEKLKCCGNCKHQGVVEWCNLREEFIHTIGYGEKDCVWKPKEDNV